MVAVAVVIFAGLGALLAVTTLARARDVARRDATFQADLAARSIDDGLTVGLTTVAAMASGFPVAELLADPDKCRLIFSGLGPFPRGHLDVLHEDGRVACSSLSSSGAPSEATHAGAGWLTQARSDPGPWLTEPFTDRLTGSAAIAAATRVPAGAGAPAMLVVLVLELPPLSQGLAATYAGPRGFDFRVSTAATTLSGAAGTGAEASLEGSGQVTNVPWRITATVSAAEALGPARALLLRGAGLAGAGLILALILLFLVNRQIARPLDQLALAEGRLRAAEEQLRLLVHGARDYAIIMLDLDGRVASWSPSAQLLDGYPAEEAVGLRNEVFFPAEEVAAGAPSAGLGIAGATGRYESEGVRVRQDGSTYWARTVVTARRDAAGAVQGFVSVSHDATVRHEVELAVARMNAELEHRVEERTTQLELQTAQLNAANAELRSFSYSISHDLRAPLRAIRGFASILSESSLPDEERHFVSRIATGAETLTNMVDALLTLSATQGQTLTVTSLDLMTLTRSAWDELAPELDGRDVELVLHPLAPGRGDPRLVRQVLANLLGNAVKYTRGRAHATIEVGSRGIDEASVYFVRDNGAGFDMRHAHDLFQVFRRLHRAEDFPGTGIGLASVQRIVARHGGEVWAEGKPDDGATFYFTLGPSARQAVQNDRLTSAAM